MNRSLPFQDSVHRFGEQLRTLCANEYCIFNWPVENWMKQSMALIEWKSNLISSVARCSKWNGNKTQCSSLLFFWVYLSYIYLILFSDFVFRKRFFFLHCAIVLFDWIVFIHLWMEHAKLSSLEHFKNDLNIKKTKSSLSKMEYMYNKNVMPKWMERSNFFFKSVAAKFQHFSSYFVLRSFFSCDNSFFFFFCDVGIAVVGTALCWCVCFMLLSVKKLLMSWMQWTILIDGRLKLAVPVLVRPDNQFQLNVRYIHSACLGRRMAHCRIRYWKIMFSTINLGSIIFPCLPDSSPVHPSFHQFSGRSSERLKFLNFLYDLFFHFDDDFIDFIFDSSSTFSFPSTVCFSRNVIW